MTSPKSRCGQCRRFAWHNGKRQYGCIAKLGGEFEPSSSHSRACPSFRSKAMGDPDPLPQDGQEREDMRAHDIGREMEVWLL
jgi:hypothetical protein